MPAAQLLFRESRLNNQGAQCGVCKSRRRRKKHSRREMGLVSKALSAELLCLTSPDWGGAAELKKLELLDEIKDGATTRQIIGISQSLAAELPPPYTAIASPDASGVPVINCRVCQSLINLDGKLHQHVVKCTVCNEATPIKNPPSGKKYVRCQCNCLLICKDTSRKIGCPRPNCRRIITLGPVMLIPEEQPAQPAMPVQPDGTRVVCGHCGNTFLWMELRFNTLAKCPHCKKISSVGSALPRRRCCAYITIGIICIFIGVGLTVGTQDFARRFHATYVSWAVAYLLGLICLIRACYWGAIKVSYPEHSFA
ncbi:PREDICTED: type 2 phosphatidylinositol 4,5-bisphosphate 4-phosphatase-like [Pterocles gutturalis]|nr:PREDICTED: type 2 phosphatidylinositol 4,5-bisphosphate 4-phosphatase-like [Pterocles gutturalis]